MKLSALPLKGLILFSWVSGFIRDMVPLSVCMSDVEIFLMAKECIIMMTF